MKKKTLVLDLSLSLCILLLAIFAYAAEEHRVFVFVLGVLYLAAFLFQLVFAFVQLLRKELAFGILISLCGLTFLQNDTVNTAYIMQVEKPLAGIVLWMLLILTLILTILLCIFAEKPRTLGEPFLYFLISALFCAGIICSGFLPMANYALDTSETVEIEATVTECLGEAHLRHSFDMHDAYEVVCPHDPTIREITVDTDYGVLEKGAVVRLKYRTGLFSPIHRVDYTFLPFDLTP